MEPLESPVSSDDPEPNCAGPAPLEPGQTRRLRLTGEVVETCEREGRKGARVVIGPFRLVTIETSEIPDPQLRDRVWINALLTIEKIEFEPGCTNHRPGPAAGDDDTGGCHE